MADAKATFAHWYPCWMASDGEPCCFRHYNLGMNSIGKQEIRTQLRDRESHAASMLDTAKLQDWTRDQFDRFGKVL